MDRKRKRKIAGWGTVLTSLFCALSAAYVAIWANHGNMILSVLLGLSSFVFLLFAYVAIQFLD